jgi:hypothetical protein
MDKWAMAILSAAYHCSFSTLGTCMGKTQQIITCIEAALTPTLFVNLLISELEFCFHFILCMTGTAQLPFKHFEPTVTLQQDLMQTKNQVFFPAF